MSATLRPLVLLHASLIQKRVALLRSAERMDRSGEIERAEMTRDEAAEAREQAEALAVLLAPQGVTIPDPRQMALMGIGED